MNRTSPVNGHAPVVRTALVPTTSAQTASADRRVCNRAVLCLSRPRGRGLVSLASICLALVLIWPAGEHATCAANAAEAATETPAAASPPAAAAQAIANHAAEDTRPASAAETQTAPDPSDAPLVLPWNRVAEDAVQPPTPPLSSAREMLELFSIDASQIRQLADDAPLSDGEDETLLKILYRLPFFGRDKIEAWTRVADDWAELAERPEARRLDVFRIEGRVARVQPVDVPPEIAARLEFKTWYRVHLRLADAAYPVLVCARDVPLSWLSGGPLDAPARCRGLFLKTGGDDGGHRELVFAAERVAWLPERADPARGVSPGIAYLASLGMDAGLFDAVRTTNRRSINPEDHEAFYQLLAAIGRAAPADVFQHAKPLAELPTLLTSPTDHQGQIYSVSGTAKRVQRVAIDEPDIQRRLGIDHYYQVDVFVSLGDTEIRFEQKDGHTPAVFRDTYPVTCCVLELPPGLPAQDNIGTPVRFAGAYFKLWAYKSEYVSSLDSRQRQVSPLFIAATPRVIQFDHSASQLVGWISGVVIALLIIGAGIYMWLPRTSDRRIEQEVLRPRLELGSARSLNDLDLPIQDKPDFSGLADRDQGPVRPE